MEILQIVSSVFFIVGVIVCFFGIGYEYYKDCKKAKKKDNSNKEIKEIKKQIEQNEDASLSYLIHLNDRIYKLEKQLKEQNQGNNNQ